MDKGAGRLRRKCKMQSAKCKLQNSPHPSLQRSDTLSQREKVIMVLLSHRERS